MALTVMLVPLCCGAKFIYGFPSGQNLSNPGKYKANYGEEVYNYWVKKNVELATILEKDLTDFFTKGFMATVANSVERPLYPPNNNLMKNGFVTAITNLDQDFICGPVLKKFGFVQTHAVINPNSRHMIYHYMWTHETNKFKPS